MIRTGFSVLLLLGVSALWSQRTSAFAIDDAPSVSTTEHVPEKEILDLSTQTESPTTSIPKTKRPLTPIEQEMADRARQHIAEVVKKNLIRLFTIIAATSEPGNTRTHAAARQFGIDEDDGDDEDITFNPNTLPQVAQLLGAIFAGNLNLTSIVDRAFYLVPDTLRNQVQGVFGLLTGVTTTTPAPRPAPPPPIIPVIPITQATAPPTVPTTEPPPPPTTKQAEDVVASFVISSPSRNKPKYKVRRKIPSTTIQPIVVGSEEYEIISDAELQRLEQSLLDSAKQYAEPAPVEKAKEQTQTQPQPPMDFVGQLRQVFSNTNMTTVIRAMPDLFTGARQAFTLLETLGQLDDIPILSDLFGGDDDYDDE